ncbi:MAG: arginine deiminase family protein [Acidobacteriota bacterium]
MLRAITRDVSPAIESCELAFLERKSIDYSLAVRQLEAYRAALRNCGVAVTELAEESAYPDACFVEDTAIIVDELAVICNLGALSRRGETTAIELELSKSREIVRIAPPATIDGGDVLRVGRTILVGLSSRTNIAGINDLVRILVPFGYRVKPITVTGCLHFKSACTAINDETLLVNREWVDANALDGYRLLDVAVGEPWAANLLRVNETVFVQGGFPITAQKIREIHDSVEILDVSEFQKAEASLTCLSLLFTSKNTQRQAY